MHTCLHRSNQGQISQSPYNKAKLLWPFLRPSDSLWKYVGCGQTNFGRKAQCMTVLRKRSPALSDSMDKDRRGIQSKDSLGNDITKAETKEAPGLGLGSYTGSSHLASSTLSSAHEKVVRKTLDQARCIQKRML